MVSLVALEMGLVARMARIHVLIISPPFGPDSATYWFMMQLGKVLGIFPSYPVS